MSELFNLFKKPEKKPRSEEEIEKDIQNVEKQIEGEKKAIEDLRMLVGIYDSAHDESGKKLTEDKIAEIERNIQNLKKKKKDLKNELPPRPLPQPEFVKVSSTQASYRRSIALGRHELASSLTMTGSLLDAPPPLGPPPPLVIPPIPPPKSEFYQQERLSMIQDNDTSFKRAIVLYDFEARQQDEISVKAKQEVTILQEYGYKPEEKDWCKVKTSEAFVGFCPTSYLKTVTNDEEAAQVIASIDQPSSNEANQDTGVLFKVAAIFDYAATKADEISFSAGDEIAVINQDDVGWWTGEINGKMGLFPSNYVQKKGDDVEVKIETNTDTATEKFEPYLAIAIYDYTTTFDDELSFKKGDLIQVVESEGNGWIKGHLENVPEKIGLVASNYVQKFDPKATSKLGNGKSTVGKSQAEFWKNMEKEGKIPNLSTIENRRHSKPTATAPALASPPVVKLEEQPTEEEEVKPRSSSTTPSNSRPTSQRVPQTEERTPLLQNQQEKKESSCCIII